jgi:RNA polymerase sigma-70 factor (ECF subfamily)
VREHRRGAAVRREDPDGRVRVDRGASGLGDVGTVEAVFRAEYGRVVATLIRDLRDIDLAEDALQDALATALVAWPRDGVPSSPGAWLTVTARRKAIDRLRRDRRLAELVTELEQQTEEAVDEETIPDERLSLIFTCCHPALSPDTQVALTLRLVGGLTTGEIARAFLVAEETLAQRIVRAKAKIRTAGIPYRVPPDHLLPDRLGAALAVVYLIFNEGYSATSGDALTRPDLMAEAIRLGGILAALMPDEAEVLGLEALLLLQASRTRARSGSDGELVLLDDQDRSLWDRDLIARGVALLDRALALRRPGPYQLQAAIAALHARAREPGETDWTEIALLYAELARLQPSPVVELNRAVAVAMADGPAAGLELLDDLPLERYHLFHSARADLLRREGRVDEARAAYERARELVTNEPERAFLSRRIAELEPA